MISSRLVREFGAVIALAASPAFAFAAPHTPIPSPAPVSVSVSVSQAEGAGFLDKLECVGCMTGGFIIVAGGGVAIAAAAADPAMYVAVTACINACVRAYGE